MENESITYKYPTWFRLFYLFFHLVILVTSFFIIIDGAAEIVNAVISIEDQISGFINGLKKLLVVVIVVCIGSSVLTTPMKITTTSRGMNIKLYFLFNRFISWDDVIGIRQWPFQIDSFLVKVRRLTIFHRVTGISHLYGIDPVFPIHKPLENINELVEKIEEHT